MKDSFFIICKSQFGYHTDTYYYSKFLSDEFNVKYICFDEGLKHINEGSVDVIYCKRSKSFFKNGFNFIKVCLDLINKNRSSIFLIKYFPLCSIIKILSTKKSIILDLRSSNVSDKFLKRYFYNSIIKLESKFFKNIIVISNGLKDFLSLKSANVVPLGALKISKNIKKYQKIKLLYVGTLENRNIHETVEAVAKFCHDYPNDISYNIIGFGSEKDEKILNHSIEKLDMSKYVKFIGRIPIDSLKSYFDNSNVGVAYIPMTNYYDNQPPTKIFEYSMSGLITIATKTKINIELITKSNGLLCYDNSNSFYKTLICLREKISYFKYENIVESHSEYEWSRIINSKLKPIIKNIINE